MKNVTLKDIANALNISVTTVSKALKGYSDVSKLTKTKVEAYAKKVNFRPNTVAAALRTQETKVVGIILPNISNYFFSSILKGVIDAAEKAGYVVLVLNSNESYTTEKKHIERLLYQKVDGIFISLSQDTYETQHLQNIINTGTTLIQFDKIAKLVPSSKVIIDDRQAAFEATQQLIIGGKKRIVHLRGPFLPQVSIDRFLGYKAALSQHKISFDTELVVTCPKGNDLEGYNALETLMKKNVTYDAIFAHTDLVAIGAIRFLKEKNITIPDKVAVVGFSNWLISAKVTPSLSTVNQPGELMGHTIFNQFLEERQQKKGNKKSTLRTHTLPTSFIRRDSS